MNLITPPRLKLDRVTKTFGGVHALTDLSLEVAPGQIVGVIGPNGAGKTTTFNVITGAYRATSGTVSLDGHEVTSEPSHRIARAGIMRTFQNIRLFSDMTVWEHLLVAQPHTGSFARRLLPMRFSDSSTIDRARGSAGVLRPRRRAQPPGALAALWFAAQGRNGARGHGAAETACCSTNPSPA